MTPRGEPVPRARNAASWLLGLLLLGLLAAGVVAAAVLFWERVDVEALLGSRSDAEVPAVTDAGLPPSPPAADPAGLRVALLVAEGSRAFFPDSGAYAEQVEWWRSLADSLGGEVRTVRTAEEIGSLDEPTTLVVPAAPCLAFETGRALFRRLESGGGMVVVGPIGTRDPACKWRDWSLLRSLTDASDVRPLEQREAVYLTVPAGLPFSGGLTPGSRIEFGRGLQAALRTDGPIAYWSNWGLSPAPVDGTGDAAGAAALARSFEGGGRLAWFGFLASEAATDRDRRRIRRLHASALLWSSRRPQAHLAAWPNARRAALVVTEDVESRPENAGVLADLLRARGIPATFFVVTRFVEGQSELAPTLTAAGEVGTHTVDQRTLAGAPASDQAVRLRQARSTARSWSGQEVYGLRPPREQFDSTTLAAWSRAGGRYVATVNDARSAAPEIHAVDGSDPAVVLLPRVITDDYNLFVQEGLSWEEAAPRLLESFHKIRQVGGLALLTLRTQVTDIGRAQKLAETLDDVLSEEDWWTGTAGATAAWWRSRHHAVVHLEAIAPDTLELRLDAPEDAALRNPTLNVFTGTGPEGWGPVGETVGLRVGRGADALQIVVDSVAAGEEVRIRLGREAAGEPDSSGSP